MDANGTDRIGDAPTFGFRVFASFVAVRLIAAVVVTSATAQNPDDIRRTLETSRRPQDVVAFYEMRSYRPAWFKDGRPYSSYYALGQIVDNLNEQGLDPAMYRLPGVDRIDATADLRATETALRLARHILRGRVDPQEVTYGSWLPRRERPLPELLSAAIDEARIGPFYRVLEPQQIGYRALKDVLREFRLQRTMGGWPVVDDRAVLHPRDTSHTVAALRRRLEMSKDYTSDVASRADVYDNRLERAVRTFQERHGLEVDGIVGRHTFDALNVPVERRIEEIELNLERWRWTPEGGSASYVEINIPAFEMMLVEEGRTKMQMKVIVGTPSTRTPVFSTRIEEVVLAPYWVIPRSIAANEILPKLPRDPTYLERNNIRRIAGGMLRQDPGPSNPLGRIKFSIPNSFGVGLHDTPERHLFDQTRCAFSHGCIRLQHPEDLAVYLLSGTEWSRERIRMTIERWQEKRVRLEQLLPLHVLYRTAWVDEYGRLQARPDIYGYDDRLRNALHRE